MGLFDKIKGGAQGLFATNNREGIVPTVTQASINPDNRQTGETYQHWGLRICGIVSGSLDALPPYLQNVYNYIYREQANNVELQEQAKKNTQAEINQCNNDITGFSQKIQDANERIAEMQKRMTDLKEEQQVIKDGKARVNKEQRLKLVIGLFILLPLTFYLFLFYSSTFYSAFFRNPANMSDVMNSMFDPQALSNALQGGITELCFVLSAPIIFLGLGFCLHFFAMQKNKSKYLKMIAIVLVTVLFDCILAFLIGKQLHEVGIMIGALPVGEEYTVSMAIQDVNTWAVIFCGFIVYIIWGIIFDMCMSAYDKMDLNKSQMEKITNELTELNKEISSEKNKISVAQNGIHAIKNKLNNLMSKLGNNIYIDTTAIRTEMNNFFSGWITQMQVLNCSSILQKQAQQIFNNEIATLIKKVDKL